MTKFTTHKHVWSRSSSGNVRICDVVGCGEVQERDNSFDFASATFDEDRSNPYVEDTVEHVLCGECLPDKYLCGTLRSDEEAIKPMGALFTMSPCAVCFGADHILCNSCGRAIKVVLS